MSKYNIDNGETAVVDEIKHDEKHSVSTVNQRAGARADVIQAGGGAEVGRCTTDCVRRESRHWRHSSCRGRISPLPPSQVTAGLPLEKKISHRHCRSVAWELILLFGHLSRRRLNPIKPVYDPNRPDGRLNLTASAFNRRSLYQQSLAVVVTVASTH